MSVLKGVLRTPLRRITTPRGDVMHGMKKQDPGFAGFGEAYFSMIHYGDVKGWKRHHQMTLNLICPLGAVRVVLHDGSLNDSEIIDVVLSPDILERYLRLTVPPLCWMAFQGVAAGDSMLLNIASIMHDPMESETVPLDAFPWPSL